MAESAPRPPVAAAGATQIMGYARGPDAARANTRDAVIPLARGPAGGERDRAVSFMSSNDRAVAGTVVALDGPGPAGWAVLDLERPTVWDANYLWVQLARGAD